MTVGSYLNDAVASSGETYIANVNALNTFLVENTIDIIWIDAIATELGYANINLFMADIDTGNTITEQDILDASSAVVP